MSQRPDGRPVKYVFVTGGVVSSLGKGLAAASIGRLLEDHGYKVALQKFDPYINVDPGTMSPYQHGEVYVTDDGAETDLDLGHYERFTSMVASRTCLMSDSPSDWSEMAPFPYPTFAPHRLKVMPGSQVSFSSSSVALSISSAESPHRRMICCGMSIGAIPAGVLDGVTFSVPNCKTSRKTALSACVVAVAARPFSLAMRSRVR